MSSLPSHVHAGATRSIVVTNPAALRAPTSRARRGRIEDGARLFAEAGSRLLSSLDAEMAISSMLRLSVPSIADWCAIYLLDEHGPNAAGQMAFTVVNPRTGVTAVKVGSRQVFNSHRGMLDILRTGCAEFLPNISDGMLMALVQNPAQRAQIRRTESASAMLVPLSGKDAIVGVACFIAVSPSPVTSAYSRADFEIARRLGQMVGLAVDNARRFAALQQRPHSRLHSTVTALRQRASTVIDSKLLISEAINGICAALDVDACAFLEYSPDEHLLRLQGGVGWSPGLVGNAAIGAYPDSFSGFVLSSTDPVVVYDGRMETRFTISSLLRQHNLFSGVAVSIRDRGVPVGVLGVYSRSRRHFIPAEAAFLEEVAEILGSEIGRGAIENEVRSLKGELHSILGGIGDGVLVQDHQGRLVYANASAARTLDDPSTDALLSTPAQELFTRFRLVREVTEDAKSTVAPPWVRAMHGESVPGVLMTYQRTTASEQRSLLMCSRPVTDENGQVQRVITIIRDIHEMDHSVGELHLACGGACVTETVQPDLTDILEAERRRIAYNIHDGLAQIATSAYQHLEAFADRHRSLCPEEHAALEEMRELTRRTVREARRVIADLRPTVLDDFGLVVALREEIQEMRKAGWLVLFDDPLDEERLPRHLEIGLFRVAQEALANARKHAGPTPVWVSLEHREATIRLEVRDDGKGFDAEAPTRRCMGGEHVGLIGMQERMALLGGVCVVTSRPGEGTRVIAAVSLQSRVGE